MRVTLKHVSLASPNEEVIILYKGWLKTTFVTFNFAQNTISHSYPLSLLGCWFFVLYHLGVREIALASLFFRRSGYFWPLAMWIIQGFSSSVPLYWKGGSQLCSRVVANRGLGGKSWWKLLQFHTQLSAQLASSKLDSKQSNWKLFTYSIFISKAGFLELVSKELNHLAAILHVYAGGLNFMK